MNPLARLNQALADYRTARDADLYLDGAARVLGLLFTGRRTVSDLVRSIDESRFPAGTFAPYDQGAHDALAWYQRRFVPPDAHSQRGKAVISEIRAPGIGQWMPKLHHFCANDSEARDYLASTEALPAHLHINARIVDAELRMHL